MSCEDFGVLLAYRSLGSEAHLCVCGVHVLCSTVTREGRHVMCTTSEASLMKCTRAAEAVLSL